MSDKERPCGACQGTGVDTRGNPCGTCDGTGTLTGHNYRRTL